MVHNLKLTAIQQITLNNIPTMSNKITKEEFIRIMDILKKQDELDTKFASSISTMFDCFAMGYNYHPVTASLIKVLEVMFKGIESKWIEYWVYELDFGKRWKNDSVTYKGKSVKLKTAEDLYNVLMENYSKK